MDEEKAEIEYHLAQARGCLKLPFVIAFFCSYIMFVNQAVPRSYQLERTLSMDILKAHAGLMLPYNKSDTETEDYGIKVVDSESLGDQIFRVPAIPITMITDSANVFLWLRTSFVNNFWQQSGTDATDRDLSDSNYIKRRARKQIGDVILRQKRYMTHECPLPRMQPYYYDRALCTKTDDMFTTDYDMSSFGYAIATGTVIKPAPCGATTRPAFAKRDHCSGSGGSTCASLWMTSSVPRSLAKLLTVSTT